MAAPFGSGCEPFLNKNTSGKSRAQASTSQQPEQVDVSPQSGLLLQELVHQAGRMMLGGDGTGALTGQVSAAGRPTDFEMG